MSYVENGTEAVGTSDQAGIIVWLNPAWLARESLVMVPRLFTRTRCTVCRHVAERKYRCSTFMTAATRQFHY